MNDTIANLYWIGGSPCSGKSTITDRLAATHGMEVYRCDEAYVAHLDLITPEEHPTYHRLAHAACDEVWMRPIPQQVEVNRRVRTAPIPRPSQVRRPATRHAVRADRGRPASRRARSMAQASSRARPTTSICSRPDSVVQLTIPRDDAAPT